MSLLLLSEDPEDALPALTATSSNADQFQATILSVSALAMTSTNNDRSSGTVTATTAGGQTFVSIVQ